MTTRALWRIALAIGVAGVVYELLGIQPATVLPWLAFFICWLSAAAWLPRDATRHRIPLALDWQWFIAIGWPFLWIWYARRTGRSWGVALAAAAIPLALELGRLLAL